MYLDEKCRCRICRLSAPLSARMIDALFRDIILNSYGADVTRVWKRESA